MTSSTSQHSEGNMRLLQFVCFKTDICAVTCFFRNSAHVTCKSTLLYEPRNGSNSLMSPLLQSSKHDDLDYPGLTFEVCLRSIHLFTPLLHSCFDISSCLASFSTLPHHHSFLPPSLPFYFPTILSCHHNSTLSR